MIALVTGLQNVQVLNVQALNVQSFEDNKKWSCKGKASLRWTGDPLGANIQ